jgi:hypothetical protein
MEKLAVDGNKPMTGPANLIRLPGLDMGLDRAAGAAIVH